MSIRYEFWRHKSGEDYAVELTGDVVTGVCGPLPHTEVRSALLPDMHYHDNPEDVDWVREHQDDFGITPDMAISKF